MKTLNRMLVACHFTALMTPGESDKIESLKHGKRQHSTMVGRFSSECQRDPELIYTALATAHTKPTTTVGYVAEFFDMLFLLEGFLRCLFGGSFNHVLD